MHAAIMETLGFVLIEAMSCGRPILAAPVGGIPEVFADGREGRYWPLDDVEKAARILVDTLEDEAVLNEMGEAGMKRFDTRFSKKAVFPDVAEFLLG